MIALPKVIKFDERKSSDGEVVNAGVADEKHKINFLVALKELHETCDEYGKLGAQPAERFAAKGAAEKIQVLQTRWDAYSTSFLSDVEDLMENTSLLSNLKAEIEGHIRSHGTIAVSQWLKSLTSECDKLRTSSAFGATEGKSWKEDIPAECNVTFLEQHGDHHIGHIDGKEVFDKLAHISKIRSVQKAADNGSLICSFQSLVIVLA